MLSTHQQIRSYNPNKKLIIIVGPTAIGKTALSIKLANEYNCPIISFDSRQFFKEMNIGTAKPNNEELNQAKHYFIDSHSIKDSFTSGKFELAAIKQLETLFEKHDYCIAVGGSGLYIDALVYGIDAMPSDLNIRNKWIEIFKTKGLTPLHDFLNEKNPEVFNFIDKQNHARMIRAIEVIEVSGEKFTKFRKSQQKSREFTPIWVGLEMERENLYERINDRVDLMIDNGLENEAKSLIEYKNQTALKTVGYVEYFKFFDNNITQEECIELIKRNSRRYSKRQMTWFKKNQDIKWFHTDDITKVIPFINQKIKGLS